MRTRTSPGRRKALCFIAAALAIAPLCLGAATTAGTTAVARDTIPVVGKATFDFFSMFPEQYLSPTGGRTSTFMPLETRNIGKGSGTVRLTVSTDSRYFKATVTPDLVEPVGADKPAKSKVTVECSTDTPDGTIGWVKVLGTRGGEARHIWLKATVRASSPRFDMSRGLVMNGQGYLDPVTQAYTGKPVVWHVALRNEGVLADTYPLRSRSGFPFQVTFRDLKGHKIDTVKVPGRTRNLLYSRPIELTVEVAPGGGMPVGKTQELSILTGPTGLTTSAAEMKLEVLDPGALYCASDLKGARPHAHQIMPGESTSYIFHATNFAGTTRVMSVVFPQGEPAAGWFIQRVGASGATVKPGETADFRMKVTAPRAGKPGDRREFTAVLVGAGGAQEGSSTVAAEVTDVRNIYYWSIDSMNPEYLSLDRKGTEEGKKGDWLMPNVHAFMGDSTDYTNADCYLPSATDMNHTNALAGTLSGTAGVYMVGGTFRGFTEHDETLSGPNTMSLLRYGPDGKQVDRMYEVAKQQTGGKSLTGFWSNKNWLADFEGERNVDIVGHSESWPLFFSPPDKYKAAGDPPSEKDKSDPLSVSVRACFHSDNSKAVLVPTMLGQFDIVGGSKLLASPLAVMFGKTPGLHAEDRYITGEFFRSIDEEDPDVSYINIGDLDNTGHFTGASWPRDEWKKGNGPSPAYDKDIYSPDMRRKDCLDICREADLLFGQFVAKLKSRGVYDNSTIVFLSDHGMENMKDPKNGYEVLDLRDILRRGGLVRHDDYEEVGGTEINMVWGKKPEDVAKIQKVLEGYTVDDPRLGKVKPLTVINRTEAKQGKDFGKFGAVRPGELYSEYWINHPDSSPTGQVWPDLFVFPVDNYQIVAHGDALASGINNVGLSFGINVPESVKFGLPGAHGGLQTTAIPLLFKAPAGTAGARQPGSSYPGQVAIGDIAPTIYRIMGWTPPSCVDGHPLP